MSLSETLANRKSKNAQNIPPEKWAIMEYSTNQLKKDTLGSKAIGKGAIFPSFSLPDANGKNIVLSNFDNDFLVISFYRGGWCPFCNMELRALQNILPQLNDLNTGLIAISPETPDNSLSTLEKNELSFSVLSDVNNTFARSLGLVFQLPKDLRSVYHSFNIDVVKHNGNEDYELPMPATYILNKNREIIFSFVPEDYTERFDPEDILEVLKK